MRSERGAHPHWKNGRDEAALDNGQVRPSYTPPNAPAFFLKRKKKTMSERIIQKLLERVEAIERTFAREGIGLYEEPVVTVTEPELPKATAKNVKVTSAGGLHFSTFQYECVCKETHSINFMIPPGSRYSVTAKITPEPHDTHCTQVSEVLIEFARPMFGTKANDISTNGNR
jgi:hypothetical protein